MSRLALLLCLFAASNAVSERRPLLAALNHVLDAFLDVVSPVSAALGDSACRRQGLLYRSAIRQAQPWALRMLDAGAKLPSGLLLHNVVQLGNFDACLAVRHEDPEVGVVEGQHCQISFGPLDSLSALSVIEKGNAGGLNVSHFDHFEELLQAGDLLSALRLIGGSWAVCVPAACSAAQIQLHLRSALTEPLLRVDDNACTSRADADPVWDWHVVLAVLLLSVLSALLAIGTIYDLLTGDPTAPPRIGHPLLAFSVYNNIRLLLGTDTPLIIASHAPKVGVTVDGDALKSFHGVRCLATLAVILGHYYLLKITTPLTNIVIIVYNVMNWTRMLSSNATIYVDTFLVMSGMLLAYSFIRQRQRRVDFSWRRFFINRYVRIAPAHVTSVLVAVAALPFVQRLINAPLVKANLAPVKENCVNMRWLSLVYVSNYLDHDHFCQGVEWYLSIEVQLLLLSPIFLVPLWKRPRLGLSLIAGLSLAVTGLVFFIAYKNQLYVISILAEISHSVNFDQIYFFTHTRCVPWLFGLAAGSLLSHRVAPSRRVAALGWCSCLALVYYVMFYAHESFQPHFVPDRLHSAIFFALMRPAWALASAWLLYACETGAGGHLHAFLGWDGWKLPSRLSYGVFLSHFPLMTVIVASNFNAEHGTDFIAIIEYLGVVVLSLLSAVVLHVAVEMPCAILYHAHRGGATVARQHTEKQS